MNCDYCGSKETLGFTCWNCGGNYCRHCRLPENHNCSVGSSTKTTNAKGSTSRTTTKKEVYTGKMSGNNVVKTFVIVMIVLVLSYLLYHYFG